jgi:hypothetical protein
MERFSFRRFLNTLGGRLAGLALFLAIIAIIGGGIVGGLQLLRIRDAVAVPCGETTSYLETALSVCLPDDGTGSARTREGCDTRG